MQAQTLADPSKQAYMRGKRILEINPKHPIIKDLQQKVALSSEVCEHAPFAGYCFNCYPADFVHYLFSFACCLLL